MGSFIYYLVGVLLIISFLKDRNKTWVAVKKGVLSFVDLIFTLIPILIIVGVMLTVVTPQVITSFLGEDSGIFGVINAIIVGSIAFLPAFVSFPLGVELLGQGAGYAQVAGLITALMSVGIVYIGFESKYFGIKATVLRNVLSLIATFAVAIVIEMVMVMVMVM